MLEARARRYSFRIEVRPRACTETNLLRGRAEPRSNRRPPQQADLASGTHGGKGEHLGAPSSAKRRKGEESRAPSRPERHECRQAGAATFPERRKRNETRTASRPERRDGDQARTASGPEPLGHAEGRDPLANGFGALLPFFFLVVFLFQAQQLHRLFFLFIAAVFAGFFFFLSFLFSQTHELSRILFFLFFRSA